MISELNSVSDKFLNLQTWDIYSTTVTCLEGGGVGGLLQLQIVFRYNSIRCDILK